MLVKLRAIDLKEHPMLLHFTSQELFSTESGSVNKACKKKRAVYCTGLDCSLAIHLSIVVYSILAIMVCQQLNSLPDTKPHL